MSDRIPPHNIEAEQSLLGCILLQPRELDEVLSKHPVIGHAFFDDRNKAVWEGIVDLQKAMRPVEIVGLSQLLKDRQQLDAVGGLPMLSLLGDRAPVGSGAGYFAGILIDLFIRREQIRIGAEIIQRGFEEQDVSAALAATQKDILELSNANAPSAELKMRELMHRFVDALDASHSPEAKGKLRGLPFGIGGIDLILRGMKPGQLIVVAARPGTGKTSLAMNVAERNAVDLKIPTGVLSLEMSADELTFRLACSRAHVDSKKADAGELDEPENKRLTVYNPAIANAPLHIYDPHETGLQLITAIMRRATAKHAIQLWIVDYLQLVKGTKQRTPNRVAEVTEISAAFKSLARELKVPIVCLSQLNRSNDKEDRKPRLSDLRDSGSIEQDADIVLLLSAGEGADHDADVMPVDCQIAKHRAGKVGNVRLTFRKVFTRFEMREQLKALEVLK
jgi:replicative DNA helicase